MDFREEAEEAKVLPARGSSEVLLVVAEMDVALVYGHASHHALVIWPEAASQDSEEAADVPEAGGGGGVRSLCRLALTVDAYPRRDSGTVANVKVLAGEAFLKGCKDKFNELMVVNSQPKSLAGAV